MANIKIANLQPTQFEVELSELEMTAILGGGWFKKLTGISTPSFFKNLDDWVNDNVKGGWIGVAETIYGIYTGGGGGNTFMN
ncbi:MAG: hypothetical protein MUD14_16925 [Hydrococcus sp. Prado102]|jgi:hypothetical protein|nr:hypothetical protein [Hydrococcus sp. Prado102]